MHVFYALVLSIIAACGVQLMLSRHILRTLLGVSLLSAAANLIMFYAGRIGAKAPPVIPDGETTLAATAANPLPQALILTAIVITMGVAAFVLALTYRSYRLNTIEEVSNDPEDTRVSKMSGKESIDDDEDHLQPDARRDTDAPDELDALPGHEGSR